MLNRLGLIVGLLLTALGGPRAMTQDLTPPAQWIPREALISLELFRPTALLEPLLDEEVTAILASSPLIQPQLAQPKFQELSNVVGVLENALGTDWRSGLVKLVGDGVSFAVGPQQTTLLMVDAQDAEMLEKLNQILLGWASAEALKQGQAGGVKSGEYRGVAGWSFDGKSAHVIIGKRAIVCNRSEVLKRVLDLRADGADQSLMATAGYQAARRAVGSEAVGMVYVNLKSLKQLPPLARVLEQQQDNPLGALLTAGVAEAVKASDWLAIGLYVKSNGLVLRALLDGKGSDPNGPAAFALPASAGDGAWPNLDAPRRIAALTLYRDLHRFYAAKNELFPTRTSGLIFFENMMGIFFSGRDLTDEVLAQTKPEIRLVVARQEYDRDIGMPEAQIPAFAVVLRLRDATAFDEVVEEAWQKALGLINFTRGQQALPGLILDRPRHGDLQFSMASFSAAGVQDRTKLATQYNFRPALALPANYVILSSTDGLARDLIDALSRETREPVQPLAHTHSLFEIQGGQLAEILKANRTALIRQDMIKKGSTEEAARTAIDTLITVARVFEHIKLGIGTEAQLSQAELEIKFNLRQLL